MIGDVSIAQEHGQSMHVKSKVTSISRGHESVHLIVAHVVVHAWARASQHYVKVRVGTTPPDEYQGNVRLRRSWNGLILEIAAQEIATNVVSRAFGCDRSPTESPRTEHADQPSLSSGLNMKS